MAEDPGLSLNAAVTRIGPRVGVVPDTLSGSMKPARTDSGLAPGTTTSDARRIKDLEREVKHAQAQQRSPSCGFELFRAGARPATAVVIAFIDGRKRRFGVESICRVLREQRVRIAPSTYYAAKARPPSARALQDLQLVREIARVHGSRENGRGLYGARKVWRHPAARGHARGALHG